MSATVCGGNTASLVKYGAFILGSLLLFLAATSIGQCVSGLLESEPTVAPRRPHLATGFGPIEPMTEGLAVRLQIPLSGKFKCVRRARLGTTDDGGWTVCLDPLHAKIRAHTATSSSSSVASTAAVTASLSASRQPSCLVYSFGVGDEISFDIAAEALGCSVFMFDPTVGRPRQDLSEHIHFFPIGLADRDSVNQDVGWTYRSFESIVQMLGHRNNRELDILKIDIEGDEWALLPSLFNSVWFSEGRVRQFVMEIHLRPERVPIERDLTLLAELKRLGYHLFSRDENWRHSPRIPVTAVGGSLWRRSVSAQIHQCLELSYIFVGPSLRGGLRPPPAAPAPQWRFGKPVRY